MSSNDASYNANAEVGCMDDTYDEYSATATCDPNNDQCQNLIPTNIYTLADCSDPNIVGSESYVSGTTTDWTFIVPSGSQAQITLGGFIEYYWDSMDIFDGSGNVIASGITGAYADDAISGFYVSNDNTIVVSVTGDASVSYSWSWDVSCAVSGCTDPDYVEYDSNATIDDGSCSTPACNDNVVTFNLFNQYSSYSWAQGGGQAYLDVTDGTNSYQVTKSATGSSLSSDLCLTTGCWTVTFMDGGATYTEEYSWTVTDASGNTLATGGNYTGGSSGGTVVDVHGPFGVGGASCVVDGCTDYNTGVVILAKVLGSSFQPDMVAGHSLGEFSALVAAKYLSFKDGLLLVYSRAKAMQSSCEEQPSTMAAVLGLEDVVVEKICLKTNDIVVPANYNCPGQIVISGTNTGIERACKKLIEAGARRAIKLPVSGAFHSPLMSSAQEKLNMAIDNTDFSHGICPIYQNVNAKSTKDPDQIKRNLKEQLTSSVLWTQTMKNMIANNLSSVTEVGPGKVLQGLFKKMDKNIQTVNASL